MDSIRYGSVRNVRPKYIYFEKIAFKDIVACCFSYINFEDSELQLKLHDYFILVNLIVVTNTVAPIQIQTI